MMADFLAGLLKSLGRGATAGLGAYQQTQQYNDQMAQQALLNALRQAQFDRQGQQWGQEFEAEQKQQIIDNEFNKWKILASLQGDAEKPDWAGSPMGVMARLFQGEPGAATQYMEGRPEMRRWWETELSLKQALDQQRRAGTGAGQDREWRYWYDRAGKRIEDGLNRIRAEYGATEPIDLKKMGADNVISEILGAGSYAPVSPGTFGPFAPQPPDQGTQAAQYYTNLIREMLTEQYRQQLADELRARARQGGDTGPGKSASITTSNRTSGYVPAPQIDVSKMTDEELLRIINE